MSVFIGSTTPSQRACLSKEFKKLYAKKTFIPRKQKIAIALNTCDVGIKGVKDTLKTLEDKYVTAFLNMKNYTGSERSMAIAQGKLYRHLTEVDKISANDAASKIAKLTIKL
jgi:lipopolysaccharide biosynthesis regulator YciM